MRTRNRINETRIAGDETSAEVTAIARQRTADLAGKRAHEKKRKRTKASKRTHHVDRDVHQHNHSDRQLDARDDIERDSETVSTWRRPSSLEAPASRPGYVQRWVRYRTNNAEDQDNLEKMMSQGWSPVKRARKSQVHELTASAQGKFGQYVTSRGLILMEMPEKLALQRKRFYRTKQVRMNEGIDKDLFKLDNRYMPMKKPQRHTTVEVRARRGAGAVEVAVDEPDFREDD